MIMAGVDVNTAEPTEAAVPALYYIEYMGSMQKADYGAHGYGGCFLYSLLDRYWKAGLELDEALEIAKKVRSGEREGVR